MRVVGQLLTFLASKDSDGIFTIMTSNNASALPPELTRSGRIDTTWYFGMPNELERKEIFRIHLNYILKIYSFIPCIVIESCAEKTPNFTGAEIKEVCKVATRKAFNRYLNDGNKSIIEDDIDLAVPEIVPVYLSSKETLSMLEDY